LKKMKSTGFRAITVLEGSGRKDSAVARRPAYRLPDDCHTAPDELGADMPMLDQMVDAVQFGSWRWPDGGTQTISICHIYN